MYFGRIVCRTCNEEYEGSDDYSGFNQCPKCDAKEEQESGKEYNKLYNKFERLKRKNNIKLLFDFIYYTDSSFKEYLEAYFESKGM